MWQSGKCIVLSAVPPSKANETRLCAIYSVVSWRWWTYLSLALLLRALLSQQLLSVWAVPAPKYNGVFLTASPGIDCWWRIHCGSFRAAQWWASESQLLRVSRQVCGTPQKVLVSLIMLIIHGNTTLTFTTLSSVFSCVCGTCHAPQECGIMMQILYFTIEMRCLLDTLSLLYYFLPVSDKSWYIKSLC